MVSPGGWILWIHDGTQVVWYLFGLRKMWLIGVITGEKCTVDPGGGNGEHWWWWTLMMVNRHMKEIWNNGCCFKAQNHKNVNQQHDKESVTCLSRSPWIFLGAPNGAPRNIQGNLTGMVLCDDAVGVSLWSQFYPWLSHMDPYPKATRGVRYQYRLSSWSLKAELIRMFSLLFYV